MPTLSILRFLKNLVSDDTKEGLRAESGNFCYESHGANQNSSAQVDFYDQNPSYVCETNTYIDETRRATHDPATDLGNFFERPVKIKSVIWSNGGDLDEVWHPWDLWIRNPRVANRLSNFKNFKGNLHLKYVINGNQFFWGKALVSYLPMINFNTIHAIENTFLCKTAASQRMHLWLDPTTSQGGELVLPFFYPSDCLNLTNPGSFVNMGAIWHLPIARLEHAQNLTTPVEISIFAWCTEVELSSPTQDSVGGLGPQSGLHAQAGEVEETKGDEYGSGPISRPANIVAAVAGKLTAAPGIGQFAMATKMAAEATGSIAKMFGYSRPREISETKTRRIWQTGDLASTDQPDTASTLALTSKQEVTIDPRVCGLGDQDELDISYLCKKQSYFAITNWSTSQPSDTILFSAPVTPMLGNYQARILPPSAPGWALTTTAWIGQMFTYWRGSMTFRFQLAASGYHKGRLLIVWDPSKGYNVAETNVVYSKIVDIAEERDFSITVGWGQSTPALMTGDLLEETASTYKNDGTLFSVNPTFHNGCLTVYVLNTLVSSGANTEPIKILVHSSSNDMEFWSPASEKINTTTYQATPTVDFVPKKKIEKEGLHAQSGVVQSDENSGDDFNAPESVDSLGTIGGSKPSAITSFLSGEKMTSLRVLLKRYALRRKMFYNATIPEDTISYVKASGFIYPYQRGEGGYFKNVMTTPHSYLALAYTGWRGSYRLKFLPRASTVSNGVSSTMEVSRGEAVFSFMGEEQYPMTLEGLQQLMVDTDGSWSGTQISNVAQGNVLDIEIPYYGWERFATNNSAYSTLSRAMGYNLGILTANTATAAQECVVIDELGAIGEDFNLFYFTGVPAIWSDI